MLLFSCEIILCLVNPTLVISFDGFRADKLDEFLSKNPNSNLQTKFVDVGTLASYVIPAFPSVSFPNHFSMVTGENFVHFKKHWHHF